jgi:serine/threonine-protein kinase RsbW
MSSPQGLDADSVALEVPGRPEYLRLVRLAAAESGTRADLSIDEVEDLRIAVDELTYALMGEVPTGGVLSLRYQATKGFVEIRGSCATHGDPLIVSDLSRTIIGAVVDEYEVAEEGGVRRFQLLKRSRM